MRRCPHCASPKASGATCRVCGGALDQPVESPALAGLETHRVAPVVGAPQVGSQLPLDLTHHEAVAATMPAAGTGLPIDTTAHAVASVVVERIPGLETTEEVLGDLRISASGRETEPEDGHGRVCSLCGMLCRPEASICPSCSHRL